MRYSEALEFLFSRLPMFTRVGQAAYKSGMGNIEALCAALGNPEQKFRSIHVAGTNGKGSTSHLLASVLQEAGYKTGLFTSPHLKDFRERIRINGKLVPARFVSRFVECNTPLIEALEPSFFEMNVALAFAYFAQEKVDIAVVETGLGGRLDSTNVIRPALSVITNISLDHTELLGNSLEQIAGEKAGIIKAGVPVVISEKQTEVGFVFQNKASEMQSNLRFASDEIEWNDISWELGTEPHIYVKGKFNHTILDVRCPLSGSYQLKNIAGVLVAVDELNKSGFQITSKQTLAGISNVKNNTGLRGRWEKLSSDPAVYCDTGHNEAGVSEVIQMISKTPHQNLHLVWGMVGDKDVRKVLSLLPTSAQYYFCNASIPRAMPAQQLRSLAEEMKLNGLAYSSVKKAIADAKRKANPDDLIVIGGSTFVVAEV
jgi:dihydrofolate synthase/folylpolyglutamate synthase